jgi:hypothetical protein
LLEFLLSLGLVGLDAGNRLDQSQQSVNPNFRRMRLLGIYRGIMAGGWKRSLAV